MNENFTHVRRDKKGALQSFKTDQENEYDYETALELVSNNLIDNAEVFTKNKKKYIRGKADGRKDNNLSELPEY